MSQKGVAYFVKRDFGFEGGFIAFWDKIYEKARPFRPNLGKKPRQAAVDIDAESKIRSFGKYDPFNNYDDCLDLLVRGTLKYAAFRGASEVSF